MEESPRQDGGWVRHYRRLWSHPIFPTKQHAAVWSWMIAEAAWKKRRVRFDGAEVSLDEGQLIIGQRRVAEDFGLTRAALRRLLSGLQEAHMAALHAAHGGTVVTVINYSSYQCVSDFSEIHTGPSSEPSLGPSVAHQQPTSGPPLNKEESKEGEEEVFGELKLSAAAVPRLNDPMKVVWDSGAALLMSAGKSNGNSRTLIGKWLKLKGPGDVMLAISEAIRTGTPDPVSYIEKILQRAGAGRNSFDCSDEAKNRRNEALRNLRPRLVSNG